MICYLSGDLVASTSSTWTTAGFETAIDRLSRDLGKATDFEIVVSQGDSFQAQCAGEYGWSVALLAYLRMRMADDHGARIAFAVGEPDTTHRRKLGARSGRVYELAGRGLASMKALGSTFRVFADATDRGLAAWITASDYADALLKSTTQRQCEVLYGALKPGAGAPPTVEALAKRFGLAKSTVSQHLNAAHVGVHARAIERFRVQGEPKLVP